MISNVVFWHVTQNHRYKKVKITMISFYRLIQADPKDPERGQGHASVAASVFNTDSAARQRIL